MFEALLPAVRILAVLTLLTGVAYPYLVTGIAQLAFPRAAHGSLVEADGKRMGSALIGQPFDNPKYFWGRPSATAPMPYNGAASSGSNQGPRNPALADAVRDRIKALRDADPGSTGPVPVDLVTASASGLDPDISPAAAQYQAARVARVRGMPLAQVQSLIDGNTQQPLLGFLGEPRVNVLALNIALDAASGSFSPSTPR